MIYVVMCETGCYSDRLVKAVAYYDNLDDAERHVAEADAYAREGRVRYDAIARHVVGKRSASWSWSPEQRDMIGRLEGQDPVTRACRELWGYDYLDGDVAHHVEAIDMGDGFEHQVQPRLALLSEYVVADTRPPPVPGSLATTSAELVGAIFIKAKE